jgi:hypothetical protein
MKNIKRVKIVKVHEEALDSLETEQKLPTGERNKIISTLIDNEDIIKVLVKSHESHIAR